MIADVKYIPVNMGRGQSEGSKKTRFKQEGDRPNGKPRSFRFPAEIEDFLAPLKDVRKFVVDAVREKIERDRE